MPLKKLSLFPLSFKEITDEEVWQLEKEITIFLKSGKKQVLLFVIDVNVLFLIYLNSEGHLLVHPLLRQNVFQLSEVDSIKSIFMLRLPISDDDNYTIAFDSLFHCPLTRINNEEKRPSYLNNGLFSNSFMYNTQGIVSSTLPLNHMQNYQYSRSDRSIRHLLWLLKYSYEE